MLKKPVDNEDHQTPSKTDPDDLENNIMYVKHLIDTEGICESPIDINVANSNVINLPMIQWRNYEKMPKKIKLTNTGETCFY